MTSTSKQSTQHNNLVLALQQMDSSNGDSGANLIPFYKTNHSEEAVFAYYFIVYVFALYICSC